MGRRTIDLLWAYKSTRRITTGETLFLLTYGLEAVVSNKLAQPTYRVLNHNDIGIAEALREELDLIEKKIDQAYLKMAAYKQRVSQYFNKRVKHCSFQVGNLVLKAVNQSS